MPEPAEFLAGFGLSHGIQLAGYQLVHSTATHESIRRYQEYAYKITLVFKNLGSGVYENLYAAVMPIISQEHIIYGIRNPYRCIIDQPQYGDITEAPDGTVTFHLTGHSYRTK